MIYLLLKIQNKAIARHIVATSLKFLNLKVQTNTLLQVIIFSYFERTKLFAQFSIKKSSSLSASFHRTYLVVKGLRVYVIFKAVVRSWETILAQSFYSMTATSLGECVILGF